MNLPAYRYGRECGENEKVWDEESVRQAQREAVAAAVPGWLPIETAPKDGTFILLWEQYSTAPFVGSWAHQRWSVSHEHVDAEGGWDGANVVDALSLPITHWAPLLPPPEVKP